MTQVSPITMRCLSAMNVLCRHIVAHGLRRNGSGSARFSFRTRDATSGYASRSHRHIAAAASRLEDQSTEDESEALETLFSEYLLPLGGAFLGKVEAHATTPFWRTMAPLTRDAISAMWDELEEDSEE